MTVRLNQKALADSVRTSTAFRVLTSQLEERATSGARATSRAKGTRRRSGRYEDGFESAFRPISSPTLLGRLRLFNTEPEAAWLEDGTPPHVITIRNKLVLYSKETNTFFGRRVNHPGTKARYVIRDTLRRIAAGGR